MLDGLKRFSQEKRTLFVCCCIIMLVLLTVGLSLTIYVARVYYIRSYGLQLKPSRDHEAINVQYYLQNDPEWGGDTIGASNRKMGGAGCLITCVASAITDLGIPVTPREVVFERVMKNYALDY